MGLVLLSHNMSNSFFLFWRVFAPTLTLASSWGFALKIPHRELVTVWMLCKGTFKISSAPWNFEAKLETTFDLTFLVPSVHPVCISSLLLCRGEVLPSALIMGWKGGKLELKCCFRVSGALWQRPGEHAVKLVFDSQTCSLAVKMDEISCTLPKWNHEKNRTWLCKLEEKSNWKQDFVLGILVTYPRNTLHFSGFLLTTCSV